MKHFDIWMNICILYIQQWIEPPVAAVNVINFMQITFVHKWLQASGPMFMIEYFEATIKRTNKFTLFHSLTWPRSFMNVFMKTPLPNGHHFPLNVSFSMDRTNAISNYWNECLFVNRMQKRIQMTRMTNGPSNCWETLRFRP